MNNAARVFSHLPVIKAVYPAILYLCCVFNYQLFKHPAATRYVAVCLFCCRFCIVVESSNRLEAI